jgi:hypothetical protein
MKARPIGRPSSPSLLLSGQVKYRTGIFFRGTGIFFGANREFQGRSRTHRLSASVARWERGDLGEAVRELSAAIAKAKGGAA